MAISGQARSRDLGNEDETIIVKEPKHYPWPATISLEESFHGSAQHSSSLFRLLIRIAKLVRSEFRWLVFYNSPHSEESNSIAEYPDLIGLMEHLFQDELGTRYSESQEHLIKAANSVVVVVHKETGSIAAYCCNRFLGANENPLIPIPVSYGCHEIIAERFQGSRLGSLLGALICVYGHSPLGVFKEFAVATRTNNKYIFGTFSAFGDVRRSDRLTGHSPRDDIARSVINHMQYDIFGLKEPVPFNTPMPIQHEFEDKVTIRGLSNKEIIYAVSFSTLARATLRLLLGPIKLKRKRR